MRHQTRMFVLRCAALLTIGAMAAGSATANCKLGQIALLPVTMIDMKPMVTAKINGADAMFAADSGAFFSMLSPAAAAEYKLRVYPAPQGLIVKGVGGSAQVSAATVKDFELAGQLIHNIDFLVGGSDVGGVGLLGQNVFRIGDVEYDLAKGVIRLLREEGCEKTSLAYWASAPGNLQSFSDIDIQLTTPLQPHTTGSAYVNGVRIRVIFDTGAAASFLTARAAARAGIKVDSPQATLVGLSRGIGREQVKTWIAPVASFKLGDEEIKNTHLRISESGIDFADMLLGADFFLAHHVYVSNRQHKLFFTYNGGPVFNLTASHAAVPNATSPMPPPTPTSAQTGAAAPETGTVPEAAPAAADAPALPRADEPKDAAEFSRRGTALAARRDYVHSLADLDRACELAPTEPDYFYERGLAHLQNREPGPALADFSRAIQLKPDHVPALVSRAELQLEGRHAPLLAVDDLDAANRDAAKEADARLRMSRVYLRANRLPQALEQVNLWTAAHAVDARMVYALGERCQIRARLGQDLPKALDDCNEALKRSNKADPFDDAVLSFRGLVRLRLGDYDRSITDFDAALVTRPKDAGALYGRGVAKLRRGRTADGRADMATAKALSPTVVDAFQKLGIAD